MNDQPTPSVTWQPSITDLTATFEAAFQSPALCFADALLAFEGIS